mgnify:FL=1
MRCALQHALCIATCAVHCNIAHARGANLKTKEGDEDAHKCSSSDNDSMCSNSSDSSSDSTSDSSSSTCEAKTKDKAESKDKTPAAQAAQPSASQPSAAEPPAAQPAAPKAQGKAHAKEKGRAKQPSAAQPAHEAAANKPRAAHVQPAEASHPPADITSMGSPLILAEPAADEVEVVVDSLSPANDAQPHSPSALPPFDTMLKVPTSRILELDTQLASTSVDTTNASSEREDDVTKASQY